MKKILLMLMLVCISKPVSAWDCGVWYSYGYVKGPGQTCPTGYWYGSVKSSYCDESKPTPSDWTNVYVKDYILYFCPLYREDFLYADGQDCPTGSKSTLPPTERKDISACNACIDGAVGTPPYDCKCPENTYVASANQYYSYSCRPCPKGTTSPEGSTNKSQCVASLPENCATASGSTCTKCNAGYFLSGGSCAACPANATCDGTATITCAAGYKLSGSTCVLSLPANCATGSNGACTKCNTGYSLLSGACVKNKASCKAPLKLSADGCCCTL